MNNVVIVKAEALQASAFLAEAKEQGAKGELIKRFRNGQELREYIAVFKGVPAPLRIRAFPGEQA